jgi:CRP-like cAMP-binding protein
MVEFQHPPEPRRHLPEPMTSATLATRRSPRGGLDDFLSAGDIVSLPVLTEEAWAAIRRSAARSLAWRMCTLRNLVVHRGQILPDVLGFAWGGIYRTLLVGSIVTTSYRNEGHFRAGERIFGTSDFFWSAFVRPRVAPALADILRIVNLRHHVAGVVRPCAAGGVQVSDGYEADYAYVAAAFVESIRRGLALCGLAPESRRGRELGDQVCTILYQVAGASGLQRVPRDLAAHERFRDAYDRRLRDRPPSARVRRMAQEIARRIIPLTAVAAGETVRGHVARHLDPETAEFLFPGSDVPDALERQRDEWRRRFAAETAAAALARRAAARHAIRKRADVVALEQAYAEAATHDTDDRLIGAILLHMVDTAGEDARPLDRRTIELAANEPLITQGQAVGEMYVVLSTTAPLVVLHAAEAGAEPRQVATLAAPTVIGEIGMWRGQPAVATVLSREPSRLEVFVIDAERFAALKEEPGFRAATAAEVQRRLSLNSAATGTLLDETAAATGDPRLASIAQLFRYLTGDSHVSLDAVIDLADDATPAECVEALRGQVDDVVRAGGLAADLQRLLGQIVATIG